VVSNDEIRKKLADRKEGKSHVKTSLNEDRTPSSEDIKEKFRQKQKIQIGNSGYLFCENCKGYYVLQPEETEADFESCQCGGRLKHLKTLDNLRDI
jgi:transcription initiation factor IIE alpha subunit